MSAVLSDVSEEPHAAAPNPHAEWFIVTTVATDGWMPPLEQRLPPR